MPLHIYTSNRMELLADRLADLLATPLSSPFAPEIIVMQSTGMQRWLAMELARRFGVWANCDYPFPNAMIHRLYKLAFPDLAETSAFDPALLTWRIMATLPSLLAREEFAPLGKHLADDPDGLKRFQLCEKIADTLDQYTLFRPDMLSGWERGRAGGWQAILWRELVSAQEVPHRGTLGRRFVERMGETAAPPGFPERVSVFGVSYLPRYHLDILTAASRHTEMNLFLLSPTREYWSDIRSGRELSRSSLEPAGVSEGNPLLASLGRIGRDFSDMVIDSGEIASHQEDLYRDPEEGGSLLARLQSDILNLRGADPVEPALIDGEDRSVRIHSCHGPVREIEVLHDAILDMLETVPGLTPRDILVMTPDIESYAPHISAVFHDHDGERIPFSIADRNLKNEGVLTPLLARLLDLPSGRFSAPAVLDILAAAPVANMFRLDDEELGLIRRWVEATGIRWGLDEGTRARLGLPPYRENSWSAGIDRLLLGYAMPEEEHGLYRSILPYDEMEGAAAQTLGKLADFLELIRETVCELGTARSLPDWSRTVLSILERFAAPEEANAREQAEITSVLAELAQISEGAGYLQPVEPEVFGYWLFSRLEGRGRGLGFLTGGVTFCAMLPMRSIPFRVICLIGMNDGAFPRQSRHPGFDLIAREPRRGDRSLRDEDRYLFLEAILSARDRLYISYAGQSVRDNSAIPPSVLVSELIDCLVRCYTFPGNSPEGHLVVRHPLQPFSREYYRPSSPLFSYSVPNCQPVRGGGTRPPFIAAAIPPEPEAETARLPVSDLLRFFDNPARFFLERRLKIRLEEIDRPLEEREPFSVDPLREYQLRQSLVRRVLQGEDLSDCIDVFRSSGQLPPAGHGEIIFRQIATKATEFAREVMAKIGGSPEMPPVEVELEVGGFVISGRIDSIRQCGLVRYRCARLKGRDQLRLWIEHLLLNAAAPPQQRTDSHLIMTDRSVIFSQVMEPSKHLVELLELYRQGLSEPLKYFPASSMAYAEGNWEMRKALEKWEDGYLHEGEKHERHFWLCFGEEFTPDGEFERVARTVLEPLIGHRDRSGR